MARTGVGALLDAAAAPTTLADGALPQSPREPTLADGDRLLLPWADGSFSYVRVLQVGHDGDGGDAAAQTLVYNLGRDRNAFIAAGALNADSAEVYAMSTECILEQQDEETQAKLLQQAKLVWATEDRFAGGRTRTRKRGSGRAA